MFCLRSTPWLRCDFSLPRHSIQQLLTGPSLLALSFDNHYEEELDLTTTSAAVALMSDTRVDLE